MKSQSLTEQSMPFKCSAKLPMITDLTWDNYRLLSPPHYVENSHNFVFFNTNGLLWLALLNLYELNQLGNSDGYPRNDAVLIELTNHAYERGMICNPSTVIELDLLEKYKVNCYKILDEINGLSLLYTDSQVNEPFRINCFGTENKRVCSIINLSRSVADCRIVTDFHPQQAVWQDIAGVEKECKVEKEDNFSIIYVDEVMLPGTIVLKVARVKT